MDIVFLTLLAAFVGLSFGLIYVCEKLGGSQ
jgi:hypothetical protein